VGMVGVMFSRLISVMSCAILVQDLNTFQLRFSNPSRLPGRDCLIRADSTTGRLEPADISIVNSITQGEFNDDIQLIGSRWRILCRYGRFGFGGLSLDRF